MIDNLENEVRKAVIDSFEARSRFNDVMHDVAHKLDYIDENEATDREEQLLGDSAKEKDISDLESSIGRSLPLSFRVFLACHNGWKMTDGSQDIFSVDQILRWRELDDPEEWKQSALDADEDFVTDALVIGASRSSPEKYLLDPNQKNDEGEWAFIEYGKDDIEVYESFLHFLRLTATRFDQAARDVALDDYFDPFEDD